MALAFKLGQVFLSVQNMEDCEIIGIIFEFISDVLFGCKKKDSKYYIFYIVIISN